MKAQCNGCKRIYDTNSNQNLKMIFCKKCDKFCANLFFNKTEEETTAIILLNKKGVNNTMAKEKEKEKKPTEEKKKSTSSGQSHVTCTKCNKKKFTRKEVYEARAKKFGGEEKMLKEYVCRDCKKKDKTE